MPALNFPVHKVTVALPLKRIAATIAKSVNGFGGTDMSTIPFGKVLHYEYR